MSNYIEFKHEQSNWITGMTFTNISSNSRLLQFEVITANLFRYDGWYTYFLYVDDTKTELIDEGKLLLKSEKTNTTYNVDNNTKKIYKP